ncbi:MAG: DUF512 domain-containing protein, partial [Clostridia bacterium]
RECHNNCMFCFVQQLKKGLRDTLYIRDDDYRLSFISGSYITCTNLREIDIQRIIDYKLSPLYISVHATDVEVQNRLMGRKKPTNQIPIMRRLVDAGIIIHTQVVLVPNINDGKVLQKTLEDLSEIGVKTLAIVPVGITKFRENLPEIKPVTINQAREVIKIVEAFYETHPYFCYCSDEFYQIAKLPCREEEYYGDYEQIENGVGLIPKFISELAYALEISKNHLFLPKKIGIFTGISGKYTMEQAKKMVLKKFPKLQINIYPVVNNYFGDTITVTGLVTATDIIAQYSGTKFDEKYLMLPSVMLKEFHNVFLDNKSVEELSKELNKTIVVSTPSGEGFLKALIRGKLK